MTRRLCLPARIRAEEAVRHFSRPRLANLYGLLAGPVHVASHEDSSSRIPPMVERLWLPAYAIRLRTTARGIRADVWTSVEAWGGQFALLECEGELEDREPQEECFPPRIAEGEAALMARKALLQYILRRRGQMDKPVIEAVEEVKPYFFPVWVYYYRTRGKRLNFRVLDGYTGKPGGAKMRSAVVNALVAAMKSRKKSEAASEKSPAEVSSLRPPG